jgi:hypothetical protein
LVPPSPPQRSHVVTAFSSSVAFFMTPEERPTGEPSER